MNLATGSSAAAVEHILKLDGFSAPMLEDLLARRLRNCVQLYPVRGAAAQLHSCDFMDMIYRGWKVLDRDMRQKNGLGCQLFPKV